MSRIASAAAYPTISTVGALLPPEVLARVATGDLDGVTPSEYDLPDGFSLRQAAARAWELLLPTYRAFQQRLAALPKGDPATVPTRDRWVHVLLRELGYDLTDVAGISTDGDTFDVRHLYGHVPVHILGWNVDLDRRATTNIRGASRSAPHSLVQELLNRTDDHLWAILTNGKRLRLLRDNIVMGRPAYVEFDLEGMFGGDQFADFAVLFVLVHATRLRSGRPDDCWLEKWRTTAIAEGTRALEHLRLGVTNALTTLGTGFLEHPDNTALRDLIAANPGATDDYYRWLLRLVYRLIFLFVAEDRDLLHPADVSASARQWYSDYFSTARLRRLAERRRAGRHTDLWSALRLVFDSLGDDGRSQLGLPALGSFLFDASSLGLISQSKISNDRLLDAVRYLSLLPDRTTGTMRAVDYKNLGSEELGSVYEALLEFVPAVSDDGSTFSLNVQAGNARKTSGSYYTPTELVDIVLDESLDPLLDAAMSGGDPVAALLAITVCDPACGSGHFLVAAARRIARRVAIARTGDPEPTPEAVRDAMRDVVSHCLYGVDLNDLAAELAKVSLWLEALTPGRPLAFLDGHIKVGNALLGATPALLARNIPDDAFAPLVGDNRKFASGIRKRNKAEREAMQRGQDALFGHEILVANAQFASALTAVEAVEATDIEALRKQADAWRRAEADPNLQRARLVADAWSAAFVWPLDPDSSEYVEPITHETLVNLQNNPDLVPVRQRRDALSALARRYRFFHWHLEFPQIFRVDPSVQPTASQGWTGGFTCVLGNPPWEAVAAAEEEFFAGHEEILSSRTAAIRRGKIAALEQNDPALYSAWMQYVRDVEAQSLLLTKSGRFPLCGRGKLNTYSVFAEHASDTVSPEGRTGVIVPTGIATADATRLFFADKIQRNRLAALLDFENESQIFVGVHHQMHFCVLSLLGRGEPTEQIKFAFFTRFVKDLPLRIFHMTADEVRALNPNSGTCPIFRTRVDAEITLGIYQRLPVLVDESREDGNPWRVSFMVMFDMAAASGLFRSADELRSDGGTWDGFGFDVNGTRFVPLYEAKLVHLYDHRAATYASATQANLNEGTLPAISDDAHDDSSAEVLVRHWLPQAEVESTINKRGWKSGWLLGWRRITNSVSRRTLVTCAIPRTAAGDSLFFVLPERGTDGLLLQAVMSSMACDYVARQKINGSNMLFGVVKQVAMPSPEMLAASAPWDESVSIAEWLRPRVLELAYTSLSMQHYARENGCDKPPYRWQPKRRALIQAEIDGAMMFIYGLRRNEVEHVLDSFAVLRKQEERERSEFRTKRFVLDAYDAIVEAAAQRASYVSRIDPVPGAGLTHEP